MDSLTYNPIGIIHSPFACPQGAPIQPAGARGAVGSIELLPEMTEGLADLDGFSHLILLYHFHLSTKVELTVIPFLDEAPHGLFATRAPNRPNPIGLSVVRLTGVRGSVLEILDVDVVDGTPLLDLKPFVPRFDQPEGEVACGWMRNQAQRAAQTLSDDRFL